MVIQRHYVIKLTLYAFSDSLEHFLMSQKYLHDKILKLTF